MKTLNCKNQNGKSLKLKWQNVKMIKLKWKYKIGKVRIVNFWNKKMAKIRIVEYNIKVIKYKDK